MTDMILKMTTVTVLYVILTVLLWKLIQGRMLSAWGKAGIGLVYGICSILSTHFGVDYGHMLLNVRDMGPMAAGLFFDPAAGIIAGLIGGVERYIAGTCWSIGSYTRIACSVSTCLAGFVAAAMHIFIFKRKRPSAVYAFFMGAVMEVFHMYVVFITHREDMSMAFYVVRTCAPPMIVFTGLGMAAASTALEVCVGEWEKPFRRMKGEEVPVSQQFEFWLFVVTALSLVLNLLFSYGLQTQTAVQKAGSRLSMISGDILETYDRLKQAEKNRKRRISQISANCSPIFMLARKELLISFRAEERFLRVHIREKHCPWRKAGASRSIRRKPASEKSSLVLILSAFTSGWRGKEFCW